jgi:hypothetical protein
MSGAGGNDYSTVLRGARAGDNGVAISAQAGAFVLVGYTAEEAHARLAPARAAFAREREQRLAFNRRFWMKDGTQATHPGKGNPDIVKPAGPVDPASRFRLTRMPGLLPSISW